MEDQTLIGPGQEPLDRPPGDAPLTPSLAAALIGVSVPTIYRLLQTGVLSNSGARGHEVRFRLSEIEHVFDRQFSYGDLGRAEERRRTMLERQERSRRHELPRRAGVGGRPRRQS